MTDTSTRYHDVNVTSERLDEHLDVLADGQCRRVLRYFHSSDRGAASIDELVGHCIESEERAPPRDRVEQKFHHCTLPKLADHGFVEYDVRSETVSYCDSPLLERALTVLTESDLGVD